MPVTAHVPEAATTVLLLPVGQPGNSLYVPFLHLTRRLCGGQLITGDRRYKRSSGPDYSNAHYQTDDAILLAHVRFLPDEIQPLTLGFFHRSVSHSVPMTTAPRNILA